MNWEWKDGHIECEPPARPKKITGTRLGAILGVNPWKTDFNVWCEVTRVYEQPFVETIYTEAGKAIEAKQLAYCSDNLFYNVKTPTDVYGEGFFDKTRGDFYPDEKIFGGMWDGLICDDDGKIAGIIECKTTKRAEDWMKDVPEYYALQAALYATLLGVDDVLMIACFLTDGDYDKPQDFVLTQANTYINTFKVSERYPDFKGMLKTAERWWSDHVESGVSPDYSESADKDILTALRTSVVDMTATNLQAVISELEALTDEIEAADEAMKDKKKRADALKKAVSKALQDSFKDGDKTAKLAGNRYEFSCTKITSAKCDEDALKRDGLFEKYSKPSESYRMTIKKIKEG